MFQPNPNAYANPYGYQQQPMMGMPQQQQQFAMLPPKDEKPKTLWIGGIDPYVNETSLKGIFKTEGPFIANIKLIKDKNTQQPSGYGFIEFTTHDVAKSVLARYNGQPMGNQFPGKIFRLNWGSFGIGDGKRNGGQDTTQHYNLFVGDLAPEIDDFTLFRAFQQRYKSVQSGKIMMDPKTGSSKGYGFVRFADENEALKCMEEMQGVFLGSRQIKLAPATQKTKSGSNTNNPQQIMQQQQQQQMQEMQQMESMQNQQSSTADDPNLATLYIGGLSENITEAQLKMYFDPFGAVTHVRMLPQKRCGFVQYATKAEAVRGMQAMNGNVIAGNTVKVSWGKIAGNTKKGPNQQSSGTSQTPTKPNTSTGMLSTPTTSTNSSPGSYALWQQMYGGGVPAQPQYMAPIPAAVIQAPTIASTSDYMWIEESTNTFDLMKENEKYMMKNPITFTMICSDEDQF